MNTKFAFSLSLIAAGATFASANIVTNGSFEMPNNGGGWGLSTDDGVVGGWYAETNFMEVGAAGIYGVTGQDGSQVLELDATGNAKVSQKLSTAATTYFITFKTASRVGVDMSSQGVEVFWNDVSLGWANDPTSSMNTYGTWVTGTGGMDKLSFAGLGTSDSYGTLIDDVQVNAVPEPASMAVLAVGAIALLRRRKNA